MSPDDQKLLPHEKSLINYNLACAILHGVQGTLALLAAIFVEKISNFKISLYTFFVEWKAPAGQTQPIPEPVMIQRGAINFAIITTLFAFMSCLAHVIVLLNKRKYLDDLK